MDVVINRNVAIWFILNNAKPMIPVAPTWNRARYRLRGSEPAACIIEIITK